MLLVEASRVIEQLEVRERDSQEEPPRIRVNLKDWEVCVHALVCKHSIKIRTEYVANLKIFPSCTQIH